MLTGLFASDVLSALPRPTCALVTAWGLAKSAMWVLILPSVATMSVCSAANSSMDAVELSFARFSSVKSLADRPFPAILSTFPSIKETSVASISSNFCLSVTFGA